MKQPTGRIINFHIADRDHAETVTQLEEGRPLLFSASLCLPEGETMALLQKKKKTSEGFLIHCNGAVMSAATEGQQNSGYCCGKMVLSQLFCSAIPSANTLFTVQTLRREKITVIQLVSEGDGLLCGVLVFEKPSNWTF